MASADSKDSKDVRAIVLECLTADPAMGTKVKQGASDIAALSHDIAQKAMDSKASSKAPPTTTNKATIVRPAAEAPVAATTPPAAVCAPGGPSWYLLVRLKGGKAFVDYLEVQDFPDSVFVLHLSFWDQRFRSKPTAIRSEPKFDDHFFLELPELQRSPLTTLLGKKLPLHFVITREDPYSAHKTRAAPTDGESVAGGSGASEAGHFYRSTVIASQPVDWREVLCKGQMTLAIELRGVGEKAQLNLGLLLVELSIVPQVSDGGDGDPELLQTREVETQLSLELNRRSEQHRAFFELTDKWWRAYCAMHPSFDQRLVKLSAENENRVYFPVTSFLAPCLASDGGTGGRDGLAALISTHIDTPYQAARFVSLFRDEELRSSASHCACDVWHTLPAVLARGRATTAERALLLCSLLLGFAMDAWVAIGLESDGRAHLWVITREWKADLRHGTHWEPATGDRYHSSDPHLASLYPAIHCVFNRSALYANCQLDDRPSATHLAFEEDPAAWHPLTAPLVTAPALRMYTEEGPSMGQGGSAVMGRGPGVTDLALRSWWRADKGEPGTFCRSTLTEERVESYLCGCIADYRRATVKADTVFDPLLRHLLSTPLYSYELTAHVPELDASSAMRAGRPPPAKDHARCFQDVIKGVCGHESVFKGLPLSFPHAESRLFFPTFLGHPEGRAILDLPVGGAKALYAVKCRIFRYPEDILAVRVMIAVRHHVD
ncbi:unnamed protein product [Vitrella brassicaformis CCMP3155]|uniref:Uncharacterized protein n=2 Tax=Vitrella brassicaformis TaxID=1169539 RepID=A0A0G4ELU3_VITBC|nr:unnamed protein product [Vitrella brassicaformis CCMP3155]|mmetsp:Transcript_45619/g.128831  ORF Transcript_45619/g.128831 Transcript_45619/m.128831 type:complete len:720 (+) Transcript_45619:162-2321(+)|eukprot:CEL97989.1 unnamed protein product [Vitrella brassicaformis CCMP3155]